MSASWRTGLVGCAIAAMAIAQVPPANPPATPPVEKPAEKPPEKPADKPVLPDLGQPAAVPDGAPPHLAKIDRDGLRAHAYWLADDARGGRHTTSDGQAQTVKYVTDHFKKLGLKPLGDKKTFLQSYPLQRTWLDEGSLTFATTKLERDLAVVAADDAKVQLAGRFVWCGNGAPGAVPSGLAGKIPVLVITGAGDGAAAGNDLQALQRYTDISKQLDKQGATAGVVCLLADTGAFGNALTTRAFLPDHARLRYGSGGGGRERGLPVKVPLLVLSAISSRPLLQHLGVTLDGDGKPQPPTNDRATGKVSIAVKADDKGVGVNVVGVLEGTTRKAEAVVFSAHHDHIGRRLDGDVFNGADDNASGTSGLLELAEAFATGSKPERSIVFLSVSGEELGLWGSDWYGAHPTWPLDKIVANVNIDMIGRAGAGDGGAILMQVTPSHQHDKYSTIVRDAVGLAKRFQITFSSGDQYYARSDHYNFAKHGVPVVFFCDGEHPDYHQVTDTPDRLDYAKMEAVARLAFWTGWQVATNKGRPQELGAQPGW
ncbi:MAG: M28 family peptidase [Planctomycetota bacterium]